MTDAILTRQAATLADHYDDAFYADQIADSERSAREYVPYVYELLRPTSVLDVGCGRGAWLKVFAEQGTARVVGFDGDWNRAEHMIDDRIEFHPISLDNGFNAKVSVDLAMTLEVAEHLTPSASTTFVASLASCSDAVMFGAAYSGQGGTNHINERPHSFWGGLFDAAGYDAFDAFRPRFWGNRSVCYWYRQNTFLYVRRGSAVHRRIGIRMAPVADLSFLDCVHPELFAHVASCSGDPSLRTALSHVLPALRRALQRRSGRTAAER